MANTKKQPSKKQAKPLITIATNEGRLRLKLVPRLFPDGEQKFIALGLDDTELNRIEAETKITEIKRDIFNNQFDNTLKKYKQAKSTVTKQNQTLGQIWEGYLKYKKSIVKASHYDYLANGLGKWIALNPYQELDEAIEFRDWLWETTTNGMSKRVLTYVNAAVEWAISHRRAEILRSPYAGMAAELPPHDWEIDPKPNALTLAEIEGVEAAFATAENININNYALFVKFLFLTGCRPGEAIGLRGRDVPKDRSFVDFNGSLIRIQGRAVRTDGSKNNKRRRFPVNAELARLLDEAIWEASPADDFVFSALQGNPIQHSYFNREIWKPIVTSIIDRDSTPYSCRDSFITHQLAAGVSISTICAWCDTSIDIIQKRYLDPAIVLAVKPIEIYR